MQSLLLTIARFSASAWIGAAVLFVINGVQQTTSGQFESMVNDQLVLLRFPTYYLLGFILVGAASLGAALCGSRMSSRRRNLVLAALSFALVVMLFDYLVVYLPLAEMITPPGKPRPQKFQTLHQWSKIVNMIDLSFVLLGAILLCWPCRGSSALDRLEPPGQAPPG